MTFLPSVTSFFPDRRREFTEVIVGRQFASFLIEIRISPFFIRIVHDRVHLTTVYFTKYIFSFFRCQLVSTVTELSSGIISAILQIRREIIDGSSSGFFTVFTGISSFYRISYILFFFIRKVIPINRSLTSLTSLTTFLNRFAVRTERLVSVRSFI